MSIIKVKFMTITTFKLNIKDIGYFRKLVKCFLVANRFFFQALDESLKKKSVGIFEYILASMLKVYLDVF